MDSARRWIGSVAMVAVLALAPGVARSAEASTVLRGSIAHAPAASVTLHFDVHEQRTASLDASGAFSFSLEPKAPLYVELELRENLGLLIYLRPGDTMVIGSSFLMKVTEIFRVGGSATYSYAPAVAP